MEECVVVEATEPDIIVNGVKLTFGQSATMRVALESFAAHITTNGLGEDGIGQSMAHSYLANIREIRKTMYDR